MEEEEVKSMKFHPEATEKCWNGKGKERNKRRAACEANCREEAAGSYRRRCLFPARTRSSPADETDRD